MISDLQDLLQTDPAVNVPLIKEDTNLLQPLPEANKNQKKGLEMYQVPPVEEMPAKSIRLYCHQFID